MMRKDEQDSSAGTVPPFRIAQRELDARTAILSVQGELDLATAPQLKWALVDLCESNHDRVIVDFTELEFIDSTAVGVLVAARRQSNPPLSLVIACDQPQVLQIFEVTGLDAGFDILPTVEEAVAFIARSPGSPG